MEPSDEVLCERAAGRDEQAFDLLVARYQRRAWQVAWGILRDPEEARDVAQEAFLRLYQTAGTFARRARFSTWFYRILVNLCLDHRRRQRWWRQVFTGGRETAGDAPDGSPLERLPAPAADPAEQLSQAQAMTRLWAAVEGLSPQQRAALLLHAQEELPTSEIATILRCSKATVRVHLHRALANLRKTLENI